MALHITDGAVIGAVVGHLVPQAAHIARALHAFGPVVGNAHGKAVVKAQPSRFGRTGQARHAGKFFGYGHGGGVDFVRQGVGQAEVQFAVRVGAGLIVLAVKAASRMRKIVVQAVIQIQNVAHGVKAEAVHTKLFQPVAAVGEQKTPRRLLVEVKRRRAPLIVLGLEKIRTAVIGGQALLGIGAGVAVGNVQQHGQTQAVGGVYQSLELVRRAAAGGGRKVAADLIAEGAVERMFQNAHELHGCVAVGLDAGQHLPDKIRIAAYTFAVVVRIGLGHAHMGLVNARKGRARRPTAAKAVGLFRPPNAGAPLGGR